MSQPNHLRRLQQLGLILGVVPALLLGLQLMTRRPPPVTAQSPDASCRTNIIPITAGEISSGEPDINPVGDRAAFWSTGDLGSGPKTNLDGSVEIFWANITKRENAFFRPATQTSGNLLGGFNLGPRLDARGDRIVFYSDAVNAGNPDGNFEIFVAAWNGSSWDLTQVTNSGSRSSIEPSLAVSGTLLAFTSDADLTPPLNQDHNFEIFTTDLGDGPPFEFIQVTNSDADFRRGFNGSPSVSADGKFVAFVSDRDLRGENGDKNSEIFLYDVAAETLTQLTRTTNQTNMQPSINGAGDRIAYTVENPGGDSEIWLYRFGATTRPLTAPGGFNHQPALSNDGELVAFVTDPDRDGRSDIFLISTETGGFQRLTPRPDMLVDRPAINRNGSRVIFAASDLNDKPDIYLTECREVDLSIDKRVSNERPKQRTTITYTLRLRNKNIYRAQQVEVRDKLPPGLSYITHTLTRGVYDFRTGEWAMSSLGSNQIAILKIAARVTPSTDIVITNIATATIRPDQPDSNSADNTDSVTITVQSADLVLTKQVSDPTPNEGQPLTYTVAVYNAGPEATTNVKVLDRLPEGLTPTGHMRSQGTYVTGTEVWTVGDLAANQTAALTLSVTVKPGEGGNTISNTAQILNSRQFDPVTGNDIVTRPVTVNIPPRAASFFEQTDEDLQKPIDVRSRVTDSDGAVDFTTLEIVAGPSFGAATSQNNGYVIYTPPPDYYGPDAFRYRVRDNDGSFSNGATITMTVHPVDDPPQAVNDQVGVVQNTNNLIDVQANDSAGPSNESQILTITAVSDPPNGAAVIINNEILYSPNPNFTGQDTFTYTVCDDSGLCDTARVNIDVAIN